MKVKIDYTNWKGQRRTRVILPIEMFFGKSDWHRGDQWLLNAYDFDATAQRTFAMKGIHSWEPVAD